MRLTSNELKELLKRPHVAARNAELSNPSRSRHGSCASNQELDVRHREERKPPVEKEVRPAFSVTITLHFEDYRIRDIDAAVSTIFDVCVALRRFMERYSGTPCEMREGG